MKRRQALAFIHALLVLAAVFAIFPASALGEPPVSRLLVIAPHPDDETLAAGGLIHSLVRDGARVKVVFMTQGDGYPLAARALRGAIDLEPDDYVALGLHRRGESVAALAALGLGSETAEYLGYPDRGILEILDGGHWRPDEAYTSRYTGGDRSPYSFTRTPHALYCGEQIVRDLKGAADDFAPDMVLIPHPADTHTDHSATYAFAMYALEQLERVTSGQCRVMCYVVHSGLDWPDPWAYRPDHALTPPPGRAQPATVWTSVPLSAGAQAAKYGALKQYASQLTFSASFLRSLVRTNELFAEVPGFNLTECAELAVQCAPLGQPAGSPVRETARLFRPGGEIKSTVVSRVHEGLLVTVDLAGRRSDSLQYQLRVAPSVPANPAISIVHPLVYGPVHTGDRSKQVRFLLSPEQLDGIGARALFEVVTMRGSRVLDRSGWFRVTM